MIEPLLVGLGIGFCLGCELCIFLKKSGERGRWPYNKRRKF